jgi:hypothetical protein
VAQVSGEVAFIELGAQDAGRAQAFYSSMFGWKFEPGPSGEGFAFEAPNVPGGLHGDDPGASPYVFFRVDDMEAALERVRQLGGTVEEMDVEGDEASVARFGRFKLCRDDQGSPFGLHQAPEVR